MGMLSVMHRCLDSDAEICVYLDPDIFLHKGGRGIVDVAPEVFAHHPHLIVLEPPSLCEVSGTVDATSGICGVQSLPGLRGGVSQRHMIIHRDRLDAALPFTGKIKHLRDHTRNWRGVFENLISSALIKSREESIH